MKITLTETMFVEQFLRVRAESFSRDALRALFAWYEDMNEDMEFDPIAICCDWTEYDTALEAAEAYGWDGAEESDDERADQNEDRARVWLGDQTTVLDTPSGFVVLQF